MRLVWHCAVFGGICTLVLVALLLGTVGKPSSTAFVLLFPAMLLTDAVLRPVMTTSNCGGCHFVGLVLASSILNTVLYAAVFFALLKIVARIRQTESSAKTSA